MGIPGRPWRPALNVVIRTHFCACRSCWSAGPALPARALSCRNWQAGLPQPCFLEADLLWLQEFEKPSDGHRRFFETWLRLAKNIAQSERPVALFGAGLAVPENIEQCVERRFFSRTHYLALVCDEDALRRRLLARPAWRKSGQPERLQEQLDFNRWLLKEGPKQIPRVSLLDTTHAPVEDSASAVKEWMESTLALEPPGTD